MRLGFADFIFDSETKELLRQAQSVPLSPKAFHLLELLIESRPKAVSKSQLHDRLWPDTFVVEANLSNLIGEVRRALDDDPRQPRYVRTVHRFGYAFRADTADLARSDTSGVLCRLIWAGGSAMLREGEHILGRDSDAAICLDSPSVSRRHARIRVADGHATFEDLGSKNGSSVGGRRSHGPVLLNDGDVITTGLIELRFRMVRPAVPTETVLEPRYEGDSPEADTTRSDTQAERK
jgi:DNA-binding winged helix-turn-helix (wHTH) protein